MNKFLRVLLIILAAYLLIAAAVRIFARPAQDQAWFDQFAAADYPLVVAHSDDGGTSPWPGDTLEFLDYAAGLGVDVLEMNVHMSADGQIVLFHDDDVENKTDGAGLVWEMTLAELQALDGAYDWTRDGGQTFPLRGQGIVIPTLESVFQAHPDTPLIVEIKQESPSLAGPLCDLIRQYGMQDRAIVPSFSDTAVADFRAACPEVATAAASDEVRQFVLLNFLLLANPLAPPYEAFQVPIESGGIPVITRSFVNAAHRRNLEVHAWTINETAEMQQVIDLGVDAIMTDRPDVLLELLGRQP